MRISTAKHDTACAHCGAPISKGSPQVVVVGSFTRLEQWHPPCRRDFLKSVRAEPKAAG